MSTANKVLILILIVVAIGLASLFYKSDVSSPVPSSGGATVTPSPITPINGNGDQPISASDKDKLINAPGPNATEEEFNEHFLLAERYAVVTDVLEVNDCNTNPFVLKVKSGDTFTVKNIGRLDLQLSFVKDGPLTISAGQSQKIQADFQNGPGLYGYGCSDPDVKSTIGLVLVAPE